MMLIVKKSERNIVTVWSRAAINRVAAAVCQPPPSHQRKGERRKRERDLQTEY